MAKEFPGTKSAANIGYALVEELLQTLVAKGTIYQSDVSAMFEAAASRMEASKTAHASESAILMRRWIAETSKSQIDC